MFALRAFNFLFLWNWLSCHSLTESALSQTCIILIQWNKKCSTFGWCLLQTSGVAGCCILSCLAACVTCQVTSCPLRLERLTDTASQDRERSLAWTLPLATSQAVTDLHRTDRGSLTLIYIYRINPPHVGETWFTNSFQLYIYYA